MITDEMIAYEFGESNEDRRWDNWVREAERLLGHDLDGDEAINGYSLDSAYNAFTRRITPQAYVNAVTIKG